MKTVFTNSQLCHVFAQQTQETGRGSNLFFEGDTMYSYGHHYKACVIHTKKGKQLALVNSDNYSISTAKHLGYIRSALHQKVEYVHVPFPSSLTASENVTKLEADLEEAYSRSEKVRKVTNASDASYLIDHIKAQLKKLNTYLTFIGRKPRKLDVKRIDGIKKHFKARFKRYQELNTPEAIALREVKRIKDQEVKQAEAIKSFREGKNVNLMLTHDLLRLDGDTVVTSRGARVPLEEAKKALNLFLNTNKLAGQKVGNFKVDSIIQSGDETVFKIGCHKVTLKEALSVIK